MIRKNRPAPLPHWIKTPALFLKSMEKWGGFLPSKGAILRKSMNELMENIKEAIELCLEVRQKDVDMKTFVGVQQVEVSL
jgi:predicted RNase H-like HicB family nuclease